jgi:Zn-finger nucleic acid-binding protein
MVLICPLDGTELQPSTQDGIACHSCPRCAGEWLLLEAFEALEATAANGNALAGTIEYAKHPAGLKCPSCGKELTGFDFRGQNLALDACDDEHGFWLDAGEARTVKQLMRQRQNDLAHALGAESVWNRDRSAGFKPTFLERIKHIFGKRGL